MQPENLAPVPTGVSPEEIILRNFAAAIGRRRYEHWFHQKTRFRVEGDELVISVTNPFLVTWLPQNFRQALLAAALPVIGLSANVRFEVGSEAGAELASASGPSALKSVLQQSPVAQVPPASHRGSATAASRPTPKDSRTATTRPVDPRSIDSRAADSRTADTRTTGSRSGDSRLKLSGAIEAKAAEVKAATGRTADLKGADGKSADSKSADSRRQESPSEKARPERAPAEASRPAEKSLPALSRLKKEPQKEPQASTAKVKPLEDASPRPARRYADLMEFVEGSCNEFALSAARQVSLAPGVQFTTLFVHGPVGVGKTHILEGICREIKTRFPSRQVVYLTAEAFANFFTQALREHKLPSFRQRFRSVDVLIIDDIDYLVGKPGIQEEFLYTLQQLESHGRQLVVAAHGHPRLLTKMSDELRTRFLAGMVCRIDAPDATTRRRILETKALRNSIEFTPEIYQFVSDRFKNNVRELEGAFNTLCAYQRMQGRKLSVTAARQVLADLERDCIRVVRLADIEQAVCSLFGVSVEDIKSSKRQKSLSQPRMLAMYLARKHTRSAFAEIGAFFGGRNHSTVIAAEKKIKASLDEQEPIQIHTQTWRINDLIEALEQQLQAG